MKDQLQNYLAEVRTAFSHWLDVLFGKGPLLEFPKRLLAGIREGFRAVNKDPIHGPPLRAARYESIEGANEIGWGTALLCFALPSYTYLVLPSSSIWKAWLGWLFLFCAAVAPIGCRWAIKRYITWPRTGYVAYRRTRRFWLVIGLTSIFAACLGALLPRLIRTEMARRAQSEMRHGSGRTRYLGVRLQPLSPDIAKALDLSGQGPGVLVEGVVSNSPAEKAGIRAGDVILRFNGHPVGDVPALMSLIEETLLGARVALQIRHGEPGREPVETTVTAVLSELRPETITPRVSSSGDSMKLSLKVMLGLFLGSNALLYLMLAGASMWEHGWKWLLWLVMIGGATGIVLVVPGGFLDRMPPVMLFLGSVWLLSGGATLYSYLRHTQSPALHVT